MKPGIYKNMPFDEYLAVPAVSKSRLAQFKISPAHSQRETATTTAMKDGTAFHTAILEPDLFDPKSIQAAKRPVMADVVDAVHAHPAWPFMEGADHECSIFWEHEQLGLCKMRADIIDFEKGIIVDLKKSASMEFLKAESTILNRTYHWQAEFYNQGAKAATGNDFTFFLFFAEWALSPCLGLFRVTDDFLDLARQDIDALIPQYLECKKNNYWPGPYDPPEGETFIDAQLPLWAQKQLNK